MGVRFRNRAGKLAVTLCWVMDGRRYRTQERIADRDTARIRDAAAREVIGPVSAEMRAGRFTRERYLFWFPSGAKSAEFRTEIGLYQRTESGDGPTLSAYAESWLTRQVPPFVRASYARDAKQHLTAYILGHIGHRQLEGITTAQVYDLRDALTARGLGPKTVRNAINGTLRAVLRDAAHDGLIAANPCAAVRWGTLPPPIPDPFTEEEREAILSHFAVKNGGHYLAFVATLFLAGLRPSEAVARKVADFDPRAGTLSITTSVYMGHEAATKTHGSVRTIPLADRLTQILAEYVKGRAKDSPLFVNIRGGEIDQREWPKDHWGKVLDTLKIRRRKWYATRHTFISQALTHGRNLFGVAKYCGTSVLMIERNYGRYMPTDARQIVAFLDQRQGAKMRPKDESVAFAAKNPLKSKASPTGFEPRRRRNAFRAVKRRSPLPDMTLRLVAEAGGGVGIWAA